MVGLSGPANSHDGKALESDGKFMSCFEPSNQVILFVTSTLYNIYLLVTFVFSRKMFKRQANCMYVHLTKISCKLQL